MTVINAWQGAVTPTSFRVRAKVTGSSVRLRVSTSSDLSTPTFFGPATPVLGIATLDATGLAPNTAYYWGIEDDSVLDATSGAVTTFPTPGSAANFTVAVSSCAGHHIGDTTFWPPDAGITGVSNHPVFDEIRRKRPLLFMHLGDLHYRDIATDDPALFRQAYDDVLAAPRQAQLYREIPLAYMWDDHDFGPNNSDRTSASRSASIASYRERVPSYPLSDPVGIWHTFVIGRVRFIITDLRSAKDPYTDPDSSSKTMMGATQKAWFKATLLAATEPVIVWASSVNWLGAANPASTSWTGYPTERQELADFFTANGIAERLIMLTGDTHALGIDDGSNNAWGGFPILLASPLDSNPSFPGILTSHGTYSVRGQYGTVGVVDDGERVTVTLAGWTEGRRWRALSRTFGSPITTSVVTEKLLDGSGVLVDATAGKRLFVRRPVDVLSIRAHRE